MSSHDTDFLFDPPEIVSLCLNCDRRECNNCLGQNPTVKTGPRKKIDQDRFMSLYEAELSDREIAEKLGVSVEVIRNYRKKHDIPSKRPKNVLDEARLIELYEQGYNDGEIAKELGMTQSYICSCRKRLGLPTKFIPKRRVKNAERIR